MTIPEEKQIEMGGCLFSLKTKPPSVAKSLLFSAEQFYLGVRALVGIDEKKIYYWSCTFLAAQSLECILKAFLALAGYDEQKLKNLSHNLVKLWEESSKEGLAIPLSPPDWCRTLNSLHDKPHLGRYPMGMNAVVTPNHIELEKELKKIIDSVKGHKQKK
ncbi:MAG: HEPN domain-containing protein [Desulfobulbaceae bacterium]